jgi:hypothetical protein
MPFKFAELVLLAAFTTLACRPHFQPRYESNFSCLAHPESVPIIVVASIDHPYETSMVGGPFEVPGVPVKRLQLVRVSLSIENVLKGGIPADRTEFFYITAAGGYVGPPVMGFGSTHPLRFLLFLRQEQGRLRTFLDITTDCYALVYSGAHPGFKGGNAEPLGDQFVDVLLTPGRGATEAGMVRSIFDEAPLEISPGYTVKKLLTLATSQPPLVRTAACLQFRDLVGGLFKAEPAEAQALARELGVSRSDAERWGKLEDQNGLPRNWWAPALDFGKLPPPTSDAYKLSGLSLCTNDEALGVPPLRPEPQEDQMQRLLKKYLPSAPTSPKR